MSEDGLAATLSKSHEHNQRDGITGLLICKFAPEDKWASFMQLLEGDKTTVQAAFPALVNVEKNFMKLAANGLIRRRIWNFMGV
jgi:hypothetical protein